ncbi:MAG TPA: MFS transporter [Candidatus Acidoferrales bacterium]|nr:MFS transporter [Candidatus Acidoferrales bacterium]
MSVSKRWQEIRDGFERPFWVANITELFERLSYYGVNAVLAVYLHETLKFSESQTGDLIGFFGGVVWLLPLVGGPLADKFGFRRMLAFAYLIMSVGYFLLGSLSAPWMAGFREALPLATVVLVILAIPAMGPAIVKPCVVGTTARASKENVRSVGYSIYYTLVNVGGMLGPLIAGWVHEHVGVESVFRVCALSVFLMFFAILLFFRDPRERGEPTSTSFAQVSRNFWTVVSNFKFMLFLVIFSGFYFVFWQEFIAMPLYVHKFVDPDVNIEYLLTVDPTVVILFTIPVNYLVRKWKPFTAMTAGLLVSSVSWLLLTADAIMPAMNSLAGVFGAVGIAIKGTTLLVSFALIILAAGELILSPRLYEYVSRLAPPGQQGVYMGFAFLPVAIGFYTAGAVGGRLVQHFAATPERAHMVWWVISGLGFLATLLMWIYNRVVKPGEAPAQS